MTSYGLPTTSQGRAWLYPLLITLIVLVSYLPSLQTYFQGDDFEWLDSVYAAWASPGLLLTPINGFFRPLVKLSYLLTYSLAGPQVLLFNLGNVVLHLVAVLLLFRLLCRHAEPHLAGLASLLFAASARYSEVTLWSASRMESMLLGCFVATLLLLGRSRPEGEENGQQVLARHLLLLLPAMLAAGVKESWVLLPFLAFTDEVVLRRQPLRRALASVSGLLALLLVYLVYFVALPLLGGGASPTSYGQAAILPMVVKLAYMLAKYVGLGGLLTGALWQVVVVALVLAATGLRLLRTGNRLAIFGLLWLLMTAAISLPVPYLPSRYSYLPLVGFWILVVAWGAAELRLLRDRFPALRRALLIAVVLAVGCLVAHQQIMLQWEIRDYRLRGAMHRALAERYLQVRDRLPIDRPILFVDQGQRRAVDETTRALRGYPKLLYPRPDAIWQQVHLAPLANLLGQPFTRLLRPVPKSEAVSLLDGPLTLLVFSDNEGFQLGQADSTTREWIRDTLQRQGALPAKVELLRFVPTGDAPHPDRPGADGGEQTAS